MCRMLIWWAVLCSYIVVPVLAVFGVWGLVVVLWVWCGGKASVVKGWCRCLGLGMRVWYGQMLVVM